jgi:hypothetical protein
MTQDDPETPSAARVTVPMLSPVCVPSENPLAEAAPVYPSNDPFNVSSLCRPLKGREKNNNAVNNIVRQRRPSKTNRDMNLRMCAQSCCSARLSLVPSASQATWDAGEASISSFSSILPLGSVIFMPT